MGCRHFYSGRGTGKITIKSFRKYVASVGLWLMMYLLVYIATEQAAWSLFLASAIYGIWFYVTKRSVRRQARAINRELRGMRLRDEDDLHKEAKRRWEEKKRDRATHEN